MARLVCAMNQSLDGYVDHDRFAPEPALFDHWIEHVRSLSGSIYGRRVYELMRELTRQGVAVLGDPLQHFVEAQLLETELVLRTLLDLVPRHRRRDVRELLAAQ